MNELDQVKLAKARMHPDYQRAIELHMQWLEAQATLEAVNRSIEGLNMYASAAAQIDGKLMK